MNSRIVCPRCAETEVVTGQLVPGTESDRPISFYPDGMQIQSFEGHWWGVEMPTHHLACLVCGHVWATIDPATLQAFLVINGNASTLASIPQSVGALMQGLPDTSQGRKLALAIVEIDRLARLGQDNLVVGRFQILMGGSRDQAIVATRNWTHLTRAEKLDRLGWITKKVPVDDLAEPLF